MNLIGYFKEHWFEWLFIISALLTFISWGVAVIVAFLSVFIEIPYVLITDICVLVGVPSTLVLLIILMIISPPDPM